MLIKKKTKGDGEIIMQDMYLSTCSVTPVGGCAIFY
jgi:hypothetical protein